MTGPGAATAATAGPIVRARPEDEARGLLDRAFTRAVGAPLVGGNAVTLLRDGPENYPAWLAAIAGARRTVHFESYIVHDDATGARFVEALAERARAGVAVRVVYDWLGALGKSSRRQWRTLREAGAEVRCFNPPTLASPFDWVHRDHRKMLTVDGAVAFVSGLCVGDAWAGDPARGVEPWRDTGVAVRGPAVADVERAFARVWRECGPPLPADALQASLALGADRGEPGHGDAPNGRVAPDASSTSAERGPHAPGVAVRVVAGEPWTGGVLRLDQLVVAAARETLWLTDAYFAGTPPYVQALLAAARDGVDVRLLVPGGSDIPLLRPLSRAGYRPLLEAGVRVWEWNGPMLHAKTAVSDGRWARVGSTNLNVASWLGNWELDLVVEDAGFAGEMMAMYEADLARATEIVLPDRRRRGALGALAPRRLERRLPDGTRADGTRTDGTRADGTRADGAAARRRERRARGARRGARGTLGRRAGTGSVGRAAAGALRLGNAVGAALAGTRVLGREEASLFALVAAPCVALAVAGVLWPRVLAVPLACLLALVAVALLGRARALARRHPPSDAPPLPPPETP